MKGITLVLALGIGLTLFGCSKPKGGICAHCPVWWLDPICLSGGDVPDPIKPKVQAIAPVESDLIPGQETATYKK